MLGGWACSLDLFADPAGLFEGLFARLIGGGAGDLAAQIRNHELDFNRLQVLDGIGIEHEARYLAVFNRIGSSLRNNDSHYGEFAPAHDIFGFRAIVRVDHGKAGLTSDRVENRAPDRAVIFVNYRDCVPAWCRGPAAVNFRKRE